MSYHEHSPLLGRADHNDSSGIPTLLDFSNDDSDNPKAWTRKRKLTNVAIIALMAILSPLASSMFTPGIRQIAEDLHTTTDAVIGTTTAYVVTLGMGPLILAPLSETLGRRKMYLVCFSIFTILQIPTALSPNIAILIFVRTLAGFFGSVGIANGGGTLSDMFEPNERAGVFGWYLLGPLLGPTLGPLLGGFILQRLDWRWIFWVTLVLSGINTLVGFFFLRETYAPAILASRKALREAEDGSGGRKFRFQGEDDRPMKSKLASSLSRPLRIFVQPIVTMMSIYQALIFGTTYSLYTNMQQIYEEQYGFNTEQVGLLYLGPGSGFLFAAIFIVPKIDAVYNKLTERNNNRPRPEFRLPLANIGSVFIPLALFWFAWAVQLHAHWTVSIASTVFYGVGQVMILNTTQNYYIDSFEKYAASAIAAGTVFRSLVGGVVPLFAPSLFRMLGYGWGFSIFGFVALVLAPAPLVFYRHGEVIRKRFAIEV